MTSDTRLPPTICEFISGGRRETGEEVTCVCVCACVMYICDRERETDRLSRVRGREREAHV